MLRKPPRRSAPGVLRDATTPYGFTVALWLGSSVLIRADGRPGVAAIFLFVVGALLGFAGVGELAGRLAVSSPATTTPWSSVQALHVGPVLAVVGGIAVDVLLLHGLAAWLAGGAVVATAYFGAVCVECCYFARRHQR